MQIKYGHDAQGGFIAGDEFSGATVYAYPSSSHATSARKDPRKIAIKMLKKEILFRDAVGSAEMLARFREGDQRNWARLANF